MFKMDLIVLLFIVGFFGGILCFAAACGAYAAISNKLDDIADKYREDNLRLTDQLDRANVKARRYKTELEELYREQRQAHFEANAVNVLIKEKNLPSAN